MKCMMLVFQVACVTVAIGSQPVSAQDSIDDWAMASAGYEPRWSVTAGAVLLSRSKARPGTLVLDGTTGAVLSNVADYDLGWAAGPQIEFGRHFDCGWDVAVRYCGIDGWQATRSLADAGNLRVPMVSNDPADFFDTASASYSSRLYSTELNLKRQWSEWLRLLAGFRCVELHEQISAEAYSPGLEGNFDIGSSNYLYGFQMGAESILHEHGPLRFDGYLKAGVYGNHIRGSVRGEGTYYHEDSSGSTSRTSFLGEAGLTASYQLCDHCVLYGGYQVMWVEGVALAGDFASSIVEPLADYNAIDGTAFYHGAQAGLQFSW